MRRTHYTVLQTTVEQIDYCMIQSNDRWAMIIIVRICLCVCGHALTHLHLQWGGVLPYGVDCLMRFCRFDSTVCRIVNEWLICRGTWTHTYVKRRSPTQALHFSRDMPISIFRMFIWLNGARGCTVPCFFSPFLYIGQCTYSRSPAQWFLHFFFPVWLRIASNKTLRCRFPCSFVFVFLSLVSSSSAIGTNNKSRLTDRPKWR